MTAAGSGDGSLPLLIVASFLATTAVCLNLLRIRQQTSCQWKPLLITLPRTGSNEHKYTAIRNALRANWRGADFLRPLFLVRVPPELISLRQQMIRETLLSAVTEAPAKPIKLLPSGSVADLYRTHMEQLGHQILRIFIDEESALG